MSHLDPVVVVGGSYAGAHAVRTLAKSLPKGQRVILLEERSHMAHLYVLPRFAIVPGFEHQAFVPYNDLFSHIADEEAMKGLSEKEKDALDPGAYSPDAPRAQYIQATVVGIEKDRVHFVRHTHKEQAKQEAVVQNGNGNGSAKPVTDEYCGTTAMQVAECEQAPSLDEPQPVALDNGATVKLKRSTPATKPSQKLWDVRVDPQQQNGHIHAHEHVLTETLEHTHIDTSAAHGGHKVRYIAHSEQAIPNGVAKLRDSSCGNCASPSSTCCSALGKPPSPSASSAITSTPTTAGSGLSRSSSSSSLVEEVLMTPRALREHCAGCPSPSETCCSTLITAKPVQADCANCASPNSSICCQTLQPRQRAALPRSGLGVSATSAPEPPVENGQDGQSSSSQTETMKFSYMIYAAGSRLPHPLIRLPKKKMEAKDWLMENQRAVREASKVLVVGSGALGIQFATDIKSYYPDHAVTLINSRACFMPLYHEDMHKYIQAAMDELGITVYHNERLEDMDALERLRDEAVRTESADARRGGNKARKGRKMIRVRLRSGREVESDLQILCIGQHHNHELISSQEPSLLSDKGSLHVKPTLQLDHEGYDHIFAIGDVANTTAIKAGHVGYWQAGVAVENIVKLLQGEAEENLKVYEPTKPMIKVTVGKHKAVVQMWDEEGKATVSVTEDMPEDLQALSMWSYVGAKTDDVYL
ncbi:hypothetical protein QFC21_006992 [Naganishia friedmannii]|uniref:Uncharacterized protein n=1 Tax=Naganishia friedmannii TaxID=89922 RepID=A0ACC2V075_9TREE|nr:hypothetical protein QFC21_006992 [Naganishia friedmannii]